MQILKIGCEFCFFHKRIHKNNKSLINLIKVSKITTKFLTRSKSSKMTNNFFNLFKVSRMTIKFLTRLKLVVQPSSITTSKNVTII